MPSGKFWSFCLGLNVWNCPLPRYLMMHAVCRYSAYNSVNKVYCSTMIQPGDNIQNSIFETSLVLKLWLFKLIN